MIGNYEILTLVALFLSASWPAYQVYQRFRGPNLRVRLTTELFFRISTGFGEAVFVKPVLLAENGNTLIEKVRGTLRRNTPESTKQWDIEFTRFGVVVRNPNAVISDHFFYSSSPLQFLVQNVPHRAVYMGVLKGYSQDFTAIVSELSNKTIEMRKSLPIHLTGLSDVTRLQQLSDQDKTRLSEAARKMSELGEEFASNLVDKIQLEKGDYELVVFIEYRTLHELFPRRKTASSTIQFIVDGTARDKIRAAFPRALSAEMANAIFGTTLQIVNPEYGPTDAKEL